MRINERKHIISCCCAWCDMIWCVWVSGSIVGQLCVCIWYRIGKRNESFVAMWVWWFWYWIVYCRDLIYITTIVGSLSRIFKRLKSSMLQQIHIVHHGIQLYHRRYVVFQLLEAPPAHGRRIQFVWHEPRCSINFSPGPLFILTDRADANAIVMCDACVKSTVRHIYHITMKSNNSICVDNHYIDLFVRGTLMCPCGYAPCVLVMKNEDDVINAYASKLC